LSNMTRLEKFSRRLLMFALSNTSVEKWARPF